MQFGKANIGCCFSTIKAQCAHGNWNEEQQAQTLTLADRDSGVLSQSPRESYRLRSCSTLKYIPSSYLRDCDRDVHIFDPGNKGNKPPLTCCAGRARLRKMSKLFFVLSFLVAVLAIGAYHIVDRFHVLDPFLTTDSIKYVKIGTELQGAEDIEVDPDTNVAYLSVCDHRRRVIEGQFDREGAIWAYIVGTPQEARPLSITNSPPNFRLFPHGISLIKDPNTAQKYLLVVNHNGEESVESFRVVENYDHGGSPLSGISLDFHHTYKSEKMASLNDVAAMSPSRFLATNDHYSRGNNFFLQRIEEIFPFVFPAPAILLVDGNETVEIGRQGGANGVIWDPDTQKIYVASTTEESIVVFDGECTLAHKPLGPQGKSFDGASVTGESCMLSEVDRVVLQGAPDNLVMQKWEGENTKKAAGKGEVEGEDDAGRDLRADRGSSGEEIARSIVVAVHARPLRFAAHAFYPASRSPSQALRLALVQESGLFERDEDGRAKGCAIYASEGHDISALSVAVPVLHTAEPKLVLGAVFDSPIEASSPDMPTSNGAPLVWTCDHPLSLPLHYFHPSSLFSPFSWTAEAVGEHWVEMGQSYSCLSSVMGRFLYFFSYLPFKMVGGHSLMAARRQVMDELIQREIEEGRVKTILELGSGLSPMGRKMAEKFGESHTLTYIETDVPAMAQRKARLYREDGFSSSFHHIFPVNALEEDGPLSLEGILRRIDRHEGGLCIVTEGLLEYFSPSMRERVISRIRKELRDNPPGVFITTAQIASELTPMMKVVRKVLGLFTTGDSLNHAYSDPEEGKRALLNLGFDRVEYHSSKSRTSSTGKEEDGLPDPMGYFKASIGWKDGARVE